MQFGIDGIATICQQPLHAVVVAAPLLAGRQRENQVAIRAIAFLLQPGQRGDEDRGAALDVERPTSVENPSRSVSTKGSNDQSSRWLRDIRCA
jgi:hypothetical protein